MNWFKVVSLISIVIIALIISIVISVTVTSKQSYSPPKMTPASRLSLNSSFLHNNAKYRVNIESSTLYFIISTHII